MKAFVDGSSRKIRADSNTRYFLKLILEMSDDRVKHAVQDILDHVGDTRYRGGRRLLELTEFAQSMALEVGDRPTALRLDDLAGFATGRVFTNDLEAKYQLMDNAQESNVEWIQLAVANGQHLAAHLVEAFLTDNPQATPADIVNHLRELSKVSIDVTESRKQGHYRVLRLNTERQVWLADIIANRLEFDLQSTAALPPTIDGHDVSILIDGLQVQIRRRELEKIREVIENPYTKEAHIQDALRGSHWLFGGSSIAQLKRRRYTIGMEVDIPLLRPDGSLHVVELKRANVPVIKRYRTGLIAHSTVHEAASQAMNYLRMLDEDRLNILKNHGIEVRRASATVVIGHPMFQTEFSEREIVETLRTYNASHSRIAIVSYKELFDNAERTLDLSTPGDHQESI